MLRVRMRRSRPAWLALLVALSVLVGCGANAVGSGSAGMVPGAQVTRNQPKTDALSAYVARYVAAMPLDLKLSQLIMVQFFTHGYVDDSVVMMQKFHPGGVILYHWTMTDRATTVGMTSGADRDSLIPPLISADVEGGDIDNLSSIFGTYRPVAAAISARNDPNYAYDQGAQDARDLLSVGLNTDLAPDVDIATSGIYGGREFSRDPNQVVRMAGPFLQGLQDNHVAGTLKHFPGLGDATIDAHKGLPIINETLSQIQSLDLLPYRALINSSNSPDMVMPTDLLMPALDPVWPAELSSKIITGVLRNQLHYNGVIITDGLYMQGIVQPYGQYPGMDVPTASVQALIAGCDMVLGAFNSIMVQQTIDAIKAAINDGRLSMSRIDQSVARIIQLKIQRGLIPFNPSNPGGPAPQYATGDAALGEDTAILSNHVVAANRGRTYLG